MTAILYPGDPADLALSEGDSLVLFQGDRITSSSALAVTFTGDPASLALDPSSLGAGTLTMRRTQKGVKAGDARADALIPSRAALVASAARDTGNTASAFTPADNTRVTPMRPVRRLNAGGFR